MGQVIFSGDLGPCNIYWDDVLVGPTTGGVKFKVEAKDVEINEDSFGAMPVDAVFVGLEIPDIEVPVSRFTLTQLETLTKGSTLAASVLTVTNPVGEAQYADAKALQFRPVINNVSSVVTTTYVTFLKAYPKARWEVGNDNTGQKIYKVAFKIFVCQDSPNINEVLTLGE